MKQKTVKWSLAFDENNNEIDISGAVKGNKYYCPACGVEIIPKKGKVVAHHFAHKYIPENYSYESELHLYSKKLVYNYIIGKLNEDVPLIIENKCACGNKYSFDLLSGITSVYLEKVLTFEGEIMRPDLILYNAHGPQIAIEVSVTHPPEDKVIRAYENNNVKLIIVEPAEVENLYAHELISNALFCYDEYYYCDDCFKKREENKRIQEEREYRQKIFYEYEDEIKKLLSQAKNKGYAILPKDCWKLFVHVEPLLTKRNYYYQIFDVKKQAGMFFIDVRGKRFFIDQYEIYESFIRKMIARAGCDYVISSFYRTLKKTKFYCVSIGGLDAYMINKVLIKSFATFRQQRHYENMLEEDACLDCERDKSLEQCLIDRFNQ